MPLRQEKDLLKKFDAFIFDWDGTINYMRFLMRMNESLKRGLGIWNTDVSIKDFKRRSYAIKKRPIQKELEQEFLGTFYDAVLYFMRPKLHNDVVEVLKTLKEHKKRIALFSNGARYRILRELLYLNLGDYFDVVISARDLRTMKPNPSGLKAIMYELHVKQKRTIYIGDMVDDIIAAKLAHASSCAIADGFDSYHKLKSTNPDFIFKSIEGLKSAL